MKTDNFTQKIFLLFIAVCIVAACSPKNLVSLEDVSKALENAQPGDTIYVKDGQYQDLSLVWEGRGAEEQPIVVLPQSKGGVIISGASQLRICGHDLTVSSLVFKDGTAPSKAVIDFKNADNLAQRCRLTDCVIDSYNPSRRDIQCTYVNLYGKNNRVDGCSFLGKKSLGVTLVVMLNYKECLDNRHVIENNYFGPRPVYGSNGAETIRVGTSQQCLENSRTVIQNNLFHCCNGEVEVISIKSSENVISGNVLYECEGVLALRHGDRNIASGNLFIGNGVRNTGGIRVVGEDQQIYDNQFYSLAGERFFSALALMNAVPNSLPNRYIQVKGADIHDNLFVNCAALEFGTGNDFERVLPPVDIKFRNNKIYTDNVRKPYTALADMSGIDFDGNSVKKSDGSAPVPPSFDELEHGKGVLWYFAEDDHDAHKAETVNVSADDDINSVIANAHDGSTIVLTSPLYQIEKTIPVNSKITVCAAEGISPEIRYVGRSRENMVTIYDGGDLTVKGVTFNGALTSGRSLASAGISTASDMIEPYNLSLEDCTFCNFGEGGFHPVKGTKGTFAETVTIRSCRFEELSGDGVHFAAELDDKGRYNSDDVIIENCTFNRILGLPVNIYRGGSDESTAGPYVYVTNCTFTDCCNKIKGTVMRVIGAQILQITDCQFIDSAKGGYSIRLDDAPWEKITIKDNKFVNSGKIRANRKF